MKRMAQRSWLKGLLPVLLVFALLAAACGDDGGDADAGDGTTSDDTTPDDVAPDDSTPDDTSPDDTSDITTTAPVELTASWTGVTEDVIRLGFTTTDLVRLREMHLVDIDRGDPHVALDALVDDLNAPGGIYGRMVEAHLEVIVPVLADEADASCVRLTEDIGVFAVLGPFAGPNSDLNPCINSRNETIIVGGQPTAEQLAESRAPWISNNMFAGRRLAGVIELLEADGLLGDKVAVVVRPEERKFADDSVIPALVDLGKDVIDVVQGTGPSDVVAGEAQWERLIELFKTEAVDSVVMVENTATFGATQLVKSDLDANDLIADTTALLRGLGFLDGAVPADLAGVIGSAGPSEAEVWELEATQDCIRVFEEANPGETVLPSTEVPEGQPDWIGNILPFCAYLRLFELAANAAGPELTHESFLAGVESLGEIEIPGQVFASLGPDKYDAADAIRLTVFDETVGPNGGETPYGPLLPVG